MEILIYIYLFFLWSVFGSFSSVIISRLHSKSSWIFFGRSECPNCHHKLWALDLIPIFSFLFSFWKCKYCAKKISFLYPILELVTWTLFVLCSYFLVDINLVASWDILEIYKLIFFLLFSFFTVVYVFYDILHLEIPDSILLILISLVILNIGLWVFFPWFDVVKLTDKTFLDISLNQNVLLWWTWILALGSYYFIMLKWLDEVYDFLLISVSILILWFFRFILWIEIERTLVWSAIIWMVLSFLFFYLQIFISKGKWMWGWDLRIAILLWLLLWYSFYFYWILFSYIVWASIWIFILIYSKTREYYIAKKDYANKIRVLLGLRPNKVELDTQIPFWPFLAVWMYIVLFFGERLVEIFKISF